MSKPTRADKLRQLADQSRETYAAEKLKPDFILGEAAKAAAAGFLSVCVHFDRAVDVSSTQAARVLSAIAAREGLKLDWSARTVFARDSINGRDERIHDLVISW
jgi:hypothetical protein